MQRGSSDGERLDKRDVEAVAAHIRGRLSEPIPVDDLADVVGLSGSCFARLFKQATGRTPHCFVLEERVEAAKRMLRDDPAASIALVAARTGFADQAHLTRTFRRVAGQTPGEFASAARSSRAAD